MKLLFQGGWKQGRNSTASKSLVEAYCRSLAKHVAASEHQLLLGSPREFDQLIAEELSRALKAASQKIKERLIYLLPARYADVPDKGRVIRLEEPGWWLEERTLLIEKADAVIAVAGGRGTVDCIQKALLAGKPVFVAGALHDRSILSEFWQASATLQSRPRLLLSTLSLWLTKSKAHRGES
jgi:hypothetical protein